MKIYKPKIGETVYYKDIKYIVKSIYGDFAHIEDKNNNYEYILYWMLENMKQNRKKKLDRVKNK